MIHIYPGMGADNRMYGQIWRRLPSCLIHDWPKWTGEQTIGDLAGVIVSRDRIEKGDVVIGSSLGGIVACEIASLVELNRLILVGSAIHPEEINRLLRWLRHLSNLAPMQMAAVSAGMMPFELSGMFAKSDPKFVRNMCKAVFEWKGLRAPVSLWRIHGRRDIVIPMPEKVDTPLDGGHLLAMTHEDGCVASVCQSLGMD